MNDRPTYSKTVIFVVEEFCDGFKSGLCFSFRWWHVIFTWWLTTVIYATMAMVVYHALFDHCVIAGGNETLTFVCPSINGSPYHSHVFVFPPRYNTIVPA